MSAQTLILDGGDTLDGVPRKLRLNDTPDGTCVTISTPGGVVAVLDRQQQHMLALYLQERLNRGTPVGVKGPMPDTSKTEPEGMPYGPGHPSYVAPLPNDLVEVLRGREFDKLHPQKKASKLLD